MKIRLFCALMATACSCAYGQIGIQVSKGDMEKLKTTTLYVLVDDPNSDYGKTLQASFSKFWKFTSYKLLRISELKDKINDENASFFAFNISAFGGTNNGPGLQYPYGTTPNNGNSVDIANLFIDSNCTISTTKKKYDNIRWFSCTFNYGIFLGSKNIKYDSSSKLSPYMLVQHTHLVDNVSLDVYQYDSVPSFFKIDPRVRLYASHPLIESEKKTISEIPFYVLRLEKSLEYFSNTGKEPKTKTVKNKINYSVAVKSTTNNETAKMTIYDNGDEILNSSTLLVDSTFCDNLGRKILAKALGLDEKHIKLVSWNDILTAIQNKEGNTSLIYAYNCGRNSIEPTSIWSTDGTCLESIDFFVKYHILSAKETWGFGFPKIEVWGIGRNDIQILN